MTPDCIGISLYSRQFSRGKMLGELLDFAELDALGRCSPAKSLKRGYVI